jgi:hypothetical protein
MFDPNDDEAYVVATLDELLGDVLTYSLVTERPAAAPTPTRRP